MDAIHFTPYVKFLIYALESKSYTGGSPIYWSTSPVQVRQFTQAASVTILKCLSSSSRFQTGAAGRNESEEGYST